MTTEKESWWSRPCGPRDVLELAFPLVISTMSVTLMHFIDRMFLMWYAPAAMAATMAPGMLHWTLLSLPLGVAGYATTFVAQYHGARRPARIGPAVWQGVRVGVYTVPLFLATVPLTPFVFAWAGHEPELAALETIYFQVLAFGAGGSVVSAALAGYFTGRGLTRPVMLVDLAAAAINIFLNYIWIFGHLGFSPMGVEGAAWATVVSQWFKVGAFALIMLEPAARARYALAEGFRHDRELFRRLVRFGGPSGLQMMLEGAAFTLFVLVIGQLGQDATAATTLAFNVNMVAFVPMIGVGVAAATLVGQQLGANRPDLAERATWNAFALALGYTGVFAVLYVAAPDLFLLGHAAGANAAEFARLRDVTVVLLRFVAAYCLLDATNVVFVSAIRGAGDTRFVLLTTIVMAPLPLLAGWAGVHFAGLGLYWCWGVITVWISSLGVIYLWRFLRGPWRELRVIEPEGTAGDSPVATAAPTGTPPEPAESAAV
jgi:MATE family multidrug resistance protein